ELPAYFRDHRECIYYNTGSFETLVDYYLEHEEERRSLTHAARARARLCRFDHLWDGLFARLQEEMPRLSARQKTAPAEPQNILSARCWQALSSTHQDDVTLLRDLEKAVLSQPESAALQNALGVLLVRQSQGRSSAAVAAEVAAERFRQALASQPGYV